eukprot:Phypoly_transcript_10431.p1 GENE.Phypoly_transcript_10431~~Phypoly_transcript_10431.p1  ORF type:complete len:384 (+),score=9.32 Phypoly_transcript_10431:88-1239(+)
MAEADPLDDSWTNAQAYEWREFYVPLMSVFCFVFCLFAQILFYIFPRMRRFPRSLLSWLNLYNIYFCVYQFIRWVPHVPWHLAISKYPNPILCRFNVFLDISSMSGQYTCSTLLCLSIFLMVVKQVELENKPIFFWSFLVSAISIPIAVALPSILVTMSGVPGGTCVIGDQVVNILLRSPFIFMLVVQIFLIGWTMRHIRQIYNSVKNSNTANLPIKYIFVRFIATILVQLFNLLPGQFLLTFPNVTYGHAIFTRFAIVSHGIGPILDSSVMIIGNTEFTTWASEEFSKFRLYCRDKYNARREREAERKEIEAARDFVIIDELERECAVACETPTTFGMSSATNTLESTLSEEPDQRRSDLNAPFSTFELVRHTFATLLARVR